MNRETYEEEGRVDDRVQMGRQDAEDRQVDIDELFVVRQQMDSCLCVNVDCNTEWVILCSHWLCLSVSQWFTNCVSFYPNIVDLFV
jgi:hypothetical protein